MVKEDIFCLERCRDAQGCVPDWRMGCPPFPTKRSSLIGGIRSADSDSTATAKTARAAARATGISRPFWQPLRKANVKPPRAGARRRTPDSKTSAITMVATAGNQSFLGYRIDKGVPGMIQCALHSVHNRPGV